MPREGVFGRVLAEGEIRTGDPIRIETAAAAAQDQGRGKEGEP
jgi:MOSC domain-containing protein YiiM